MYQFATSRDFLSLSRERENRSCVEYPTTKFSIRLTLAFFKPVGMLETLAAHYSNERLLSKVVFRETDSQLLNDT